MGPLHKNLAASTRDKPASHDALEDLRRSAVSRALVNRLQGKISNYEREAANLEIRGRHDDAHALRRSARQLRMILRPRPPEPGASR